MVEKLEREALVDYQLAVQARLAGAEKVTPVTVDEARARFDTWLVSPLHAAAGEDADQLLLHRFLGVA